MFVSVTLNTDLYSQPGKYSIDGSTLSIVPQTNSWTAYFIDSTVLDLYNRSDRLQYREVLHRSKSFTYSLDSWQGDKFLGRTISRPGPYELEQASILFRSVNQPICANATPLQVYEAMYSYMSNYVGWCRQNCPKTGPNPSGAYGSILSGQKSDIGSQAYLDDRTRVLLCPPQGGQSQ
jgi:hypothetical protein